MEKANHKDHKTSLCANISEADCDRYLDFRDLFNSLYERFQDLHRQFEELHHQSQELHSQGRLHDQGKDLHNQAMGLHEEAMSVLKQAKTARTLADEIVHKEEPMQEEPRQQADKSSPQETGH